MPLRKTRQTEITATVSRITIDSQTGDISLRYDVRDGGSVNFKHVRFSNTRPTDKTGEPLLDDSGQPVLSDAEYLLRSPLPRAHGPRPTTWGELLEYIKKQAHPFIRAQVEEWQDSEEA